MANAGVVEMEVYLKEVPGLLQTEADGALGYLPGNSEEAFRLLINKMTNGRSDFAATDILPVSVPALCLPKLLPPPPVIWSAKVSCFLPTAIHHSYGSASLLPQNSLWMPQKWGRTDWN